MCGAGIQDFDKEIWLMRGIVEQSEMLKLRKMVIDLNDNLDRVLLTTNRERVQRYIHTHRRFTIAEADEIAGMHINLMKGLNNGKEAITVHTNDTQGNA